MTETEQTSVDHATEAMVEMAGEALVPIPAESLHALLAAGSIVQSMIYRAWSNLENSNTDLLSAAAGLGLMIDREPSEEEIDAGEFSADDVVMALSPAFEATMAGYSAGLRDVQEIGDADEQLPFGDDGTATP